MVVFLGFGKGGYIPGLEYRDESTKKNIVHAKIMMMIVMMMLSVCTVRTVCHVDKKRYARIHRNIYREKEKRGGGGLGDMGVTWGS